MIKHGEAPYLECSSRGEKRLSAFYAKIRGKTIEDQYQAAKVLEDGTTGHTWREAKGKKALNQEDCAKLYSELWNVYMSKHPELLKMIREATGLSDYFGKKGHCCQATELWRIRNDRKNFPDEKVTKNGH